MPTLKVALRAEFAAEGRRIVDEARRQTPRAHGTYRPGGMVVSSMSNVEHMAAQLRATGITLQPRREVTEVDPGIYQVSDSTFSTTDRTLAVAVAAELDRVEPLGSGRRNA